MFGWFHISGHSGTQFKHRTVFANQKTAQQQALKASDTPDTEEVAALRREELKARFSNAKQSRRLYRWVIFPFLSAFFLLLFFTLHYTSRDWTAYEHHQRIARMKLALDYENEEHTQAYQVLVKTGNHYLFGDQLEEAQAEFTRALRLNGYGVAANLGMSETLWKKCLTKGEHCKLALAYIEFTAEIAPQHRGDLEDLLSGEEP